MNTILDSTSAIDPSATIVQETSKLFKFKNLSFNYLLTNLLPALIIIIVGVFINKGIIKLEKKLMARKNRKLNPVLDVFIIRFTTIIITIIVALEACSALGIDSTSILTLFAACTAAVALALKDSLSNLASGILIILTQPFTKGDFISCGENKGYVQCIDLLYSTIITHENQTICIPNSKLTGNTIVNFTGQKIRRVDVEFGVDYSTDLDTARNATFKLAQESGLFLEKPNMACNVEDHAASCISMKFKGWVNTPNYFKAYYYMNDHLKDALNAAGVKIPFPQMDIHYYNMDGEKTGDQIVSKQE